MTNRDKDDKKKKEEDEKCFICKGTGVITMVEFPYEEKKCPYCHGTGKEQ